ncbi:hypothetical protein [Nocardia sp. CC201C]|uniref:hypothetical protein n=1 Tax=Nocardia sp. CC201C TaxID=3044575 RepID=UPI0024A86BB2|nr:hypothetical protein [Nocardia sp. CC201C]
MTLHRFSVLIASGGALAYAISKVELTIRGELGMPGFPAPASAYGQFDPVSGQLSNAGVGVLTAALILVLLRPPARPVWRAALLSISWLGTIIVGVGVVIFTLRAAGVAPSLGVPAIGWQSWVALVAGAIWVAAWALANLTAATLSRQSSRGLSSSKLLTPSHHRRRHRTSSLGANE